MALSQAPACLLLAFPARPAPPPPQALALLGSGDEELQGRLDDCLQALEGAAWKGGGGYWRRGDAGVLQGNTYYCYTRPPARLPARPPAGIGPCPLPFLPGTHTHTPPAAGEQPWAWAEVPDMHHRPDLLELSVPTWLQSSPQQARSGVQVGRYAGGCISEGLVRDGGRAL